MRETRKGKAPRFSWSEPGWGGSWDVGVGVEEGEGEGSEAQAAAQGAQTFLEGWADAQELETR